MTDTNYSTLMDSINKIGFPIVLCLLFVWGMYLVFQEQTRQIDALRADMNEQRVFMRETLSKQLDRSSNIIERNTELYAKLYEKVGEKP